MTDLKPFDPLGVEHIGYIPLSLPHRYEVRLEHGIGVLYVVVHPLNGGENIVKAILPITALGIRLASELAQDLLRASELVAEVSASPGGGSGASPSPATTPPPGEE